MSSKLSKKEAQALWERIWDALADAHVAIVEVIKNRAWEPLGYESFTDAWYATSRDRIELAKALRPHVVYQMIAEGLTDDEIAEAVKDVGPATADALRRQRQNGVPADQASTDVKQHPRVTQPNTMHLQFGPELMIEFARIAAERDLMVNVVAMEVVKKRFRELDNEPVE